MPGGHRLASLVPLQANHYANNRHASKYDPAYCDQIRDMAQQGMFPEEWCGHIGVVMRTLYQWADTYPEFEEAVTISWHILAAVHAEKLRNLITMGSPTASVQFRMMARRFRTAWGEGAGKATLEDFENRHAPPPGDESQRPLTALSQAELDAEIARLIARRQHEGKKA